MKASRLVCVISAEGVLDTLVDSRQPSLTLRGALRALALFTSSEFGVHSFLLTFSMATAVYDFSDSLSCLRFTFKERTVQVIFVRPWNYPKPVTGCRDLDMGIIAGRMTM